jgi:hypothetical protein
MPLLATDILYHVSVLNTEACCAIPQRKELIKRRVKNALEITALFQIKTLRY